MIIWWFVFFLIGILFLPLAVLTFGRFIDRGYIFSKILGTLLVSYTIFLLGTVKLLPFSYTSIIFILFLVGATSIILLFRFRGTILPLVTSSWKLLLFEEILFFVALWFWTYIRAHEPSIHGLEKYMDFGFVNSILRTDFFPAKDLWLTPLSINYYYFGHLYTGVLTKLSGLDAIVTFNLMIATLFAFTFTASFSIGFNLFHMFLESQKKFSPRKVFRLSFASGLLSAFLVTFAGNLHTIYAFFAPYDGDHPVPFWKLAWDFDFSNYWYPNATRFIPFTIHEFPIYSFVVSDLHGHVLSIPIVLTIIALLLSFVMPERSITKEGTRKHFGRWHFTNLNLFTVSEGQRFRLSRFDFRILLLSFLLATAYMTNAWDGLIYLVLTALVVAFLAWHKRNDIIRIGLLLAAVAVGFFLFTLPFFDPF